MPEYSSNTLIPTDATKVPGMQGSNAGNFQLDALKAYILAEKAQANGLATLDAEGKLNSSQIPASLDDVLVYASYASLPATGETGKLYITSDVNGTYYWNGTSYQILNQSFVRYRGSVSSLPSDPQPGDWFIAASSFSAYTSGHIYLYNGSSWDDVTAVFGQFVLKTDIAQTIGPEIDKVPSNAAVNGAINAISTPVDYQSQLTFASGISMDNGDWQVYKLGRLVVLNFRISLSTAWVSKSLSLGTVLPSALLPLTTRTMSISFSDDNNDSLGQCIMDGAGVMTLYRNNTLSCSSVRIFGCFLALT